MNELICMIHDDTVEMKYKDVAIPEPTPEEMARIERLFESVMGPSGDERIG